MDTLSTDTSRWIILGSVLGGLIAFMFLWWFIHYKISTLRDTISDTKVLKDDGKQTDEAAHPLDFRFYEPQIQNTFTLPDNTTNNIALANETNY